MKLAVNAADLFRDENMKMPHTIPIGSLVEVDLNYSSKHGVRGFVVEHTRDCDGTPLYAIGLKPAEELAEIRNMNYHLYRFMIEDGWPEDCLLIIKENK